MSVPLKQFKARAIAEKRNKETIMKDNSDSLFFRQLKESSLHPKIISQARKSGQLNLSNRGIAEVPDIVWNINSLSSEETKALSVSLDSREGDQWWEFVDLTKLILASNVLKTISSEISNYKALIVLDLHDNALTSLPDSISELQCLKKLNLSRNNLEEIPDCIFSLKMLQTLLIQHNKLHVLSDDIGNLSVLEELDLSHNHLKKIPPSIGFLSRVSDLNLSNNEIIIIPPEISGMSALKRIDLSKNKLKKLPNFIEMLHHLEQLYMQHNNITELPLLSTCTAIKEIHSGFNSIELLSSEFLETIVGIKILDLRDNKISDVPEDICSLQALERLDLSNNNLSNLPYSLGTLPHLKFLSIEGNSMRSIRRDIIQRGTVQLLKWFRSRMTDSASSRGVSVVDSTKENCCSPSIDKYALKSTKALVLSNKNISTIQKDVFQKALEADVNTVDLSKNNIMDLPEDIQVILPKLTELNLEQNRISFLPSCVGLSERLQYLNLRSNQLNDLPGEISNLCQLREINISFNKFQDLPSSLYDLKHLEIILASDNQLADINVDGLRKLPVLSVLDLHNNSIQFVPPELGNLTQIRSLLLEGNLFRNPRLAILKKGTLELLEYLRSRISS